MNFLDLITPAHQKGNSIGLRTKIELICEQRNHHLVEQSHTRRRVLNTLARGSQNHGANQHAARHTGRHRLFHSCKAAADYDIRAIPLSSGNHILDVRSRMLPIGIKLNCIVIIMLVGIAHTRLKRAGKAKIHRQTYVIVASFFADIERTVARPIIDNHIINARCVVPQILNSGHNVVLFVIRRYDGKHATISH